MRFLRSINSIRLNAQREFSSRVLLMLNESDLLKVPEEVLKSASLFKIAPLEAAHRITALAGIPSDIKKPQKIAEKTEYAFKPLNHQSEEDFQTFKTIVADKSVMFTSIWMERAFGERFREFLAQRYKLDLKTRGEVERAIKKDPEAAKVIGEALSDFFAQKENADSLKDKFIRITEYNGVLGLGYQAIIDKKTSKLVGGGGAVPLDSKGATVDVCLHILPECQKSGIGKTVMKEIIDDAFAKGAARCVGTSILEHPGMGRVLDQLCSGYIKKNNPEKNDTTYEITAKMWREKDEPLVKNGRNASDVIFGSPYRRSQALAL